MNLRTITLGCAIAVALGSLAPDSLAQGKPNFRIKSIRRNSLEAPSYSSSGGDLGGRAPGINRQWYKIETQFQSEPDWADDVQIKYFVLIGQGREQRLLAGDVTHVNIAKGSQHYSAMFLHPNTLRRYGAGQVEAVAVQIFHKGRLEDQESEPKTGGRWWEQFTPVTGFLLAPQDTPWSVIGPDRFEAIKPRQ